MDNSNYYNIFTEPEWYISWADTIATYPKYKIIGSKPYILTSVPLVLKKKRRPYPFNRFIEYPAQDIAYDIDITSCAESLKNIATSGWDIIDLRHLNEKSQIIPLIEKAVPGKLRNLRQDDKLWKIKLNDDFGTYLNRLETECRKRFRYYLNRVKKLSGFNFYFISGDFEKHWDRFIVLHKERIGNKQEATVFSNSLYADFYKSFSKKHFGKGTLRLACLESGGETEGMLLGIEKYGTFYYINSGFSQAIAKYSPGIVMPLLCIEYSIKNGLEWFNLLGGDDKYKSALGAQAYSTQRITVYRNQIIKILEESFNKILRK